MALLRDWPSARQDGARPDTTSALPSLTLPPGEYVVEVDLPQAVDWTLTITEVPAADGAPVP